MSGAGVDRAAAEGAAQPEAAALAGGRHRGARSSAVEGGTHEASHGAGFGKL